MCPASRLVHLHPPLRIRISQQDQLLRIHQIPVRPYSESHPSRLQCEPMRLRPFHLQDVFLILQRQSNVQIGGTMTMHEFHTINSILGSSEPVRTLGHTWEPKYPFL